MAKPMAEHKKEEGILKEFLIERVKSYKAIWDTANTNNVKVNVVTNGKGHTKNLQVGQAGQAGQA
jgi:hypothetical protein